MTITRLELNDFGVYADKQSIDLDHVPPGKPIVLIGGENGRGKTTLLEALFLVLYGKTSPHFLSSGKSYQNYLESRINDRSNTRRASIGVTLVIHLQEGPTQLEVFRDWTFGDPKQNERFSVRRDGTRDVWLSDNWLNFWNQILPPNIAELFFFDGERIESLADASTSARVIKDSVYALFGLAPITRLRSDLAVVEKRCMRDSVKTKHSELHKAFEIHEKDEQELLTVNEECERFEQQRANLRYEIEKLHKELIVLGGGPEILKNREDLKHEISLLRKEAEQIDIELRAIAAGDAPLLLISDLAARTADAVRSESQTVQVELERQIARSYQKQILERIGRHGNQVDNPITVELKAFFDEKLSQLGQTISARVFPDSALEFLHQWPAFRQNLDATEKEIGIRLSTRRTLATELERSQARLLAMPAEEIVQPILENERMLLVELDGVEARLAESNQKKATALRNHEESINRYARIAEEELRRQNAEEDTVRVIAHSQRTSTILKALEHRLIRKHLSKLEIELTEKLAMLHSKRLVENVRIIPETFEIELSTADGKTMPASRLSAGERQLLALAVLWAVQAYSDKKMPMIVDTPLGRLDSKHRKNMVERFLTEASHQTLVLSTDSEVTPELIAEVKDYVGAQFRLDYHAEDHSTRIVDGYFTDQEAKAYEYQVS